MATRVCLKVRDKKVLLVLVPEHKDEPEYTSLVRAFKKFELTDQYCQTKALNCYSVFEYFDTEFNESMEVPVGCLKLPSQSLTLRFSPIDSPQKQVSLSDFM